MCLSPSFHGQLPLSLRPLFQLHAGREEESSSTQSFYDLKQGYTTISYTIFKLHQIH